MYQKLVDLILKALEGQNLGNNKVVVETTSSGIVEVTDFDEEATMEEIASLKKELEEKEAELETAHMEMDALKERIEELEEELE